MYSIVVFSSYVNGDFTIIAKVFSVMTLAQFIGTVTLPIGLKIFGKKGYMIVLNVVMMAGFLALYLNPYCGTGYLMVVSVVCGFVNASAAICPGMGYLTPSNTATGNLEDVRKVLQLPCSVLV